MPVSVSGASGEATVTIRGDQVVELRYNQDRDASLCYRIVGNCVR